MTGAARRKMKKAVKKMKAAGDEMAEAAVMPGAGSESDEEVAMAPMGGRKARSKARSKGMMGRLGRYF
jgi:hypothetical protein